MRLCGSPHGTSSPYLVGPKGFFLRHGASLKPLLWDARSNSAVPYDTPEIEPLLEGCFTVASALEVGADDERWVYTEVAAETTFTRLVEHMRRYSPEWAQALCDVPAAKIRQVAGEYIDQACVGQSVCCTPSPSPPAACCSPGG